jgi:hypothetical protein
MVARDPKFNRFDEVIAEIYELPSPARLRRLAIQKAIVDYLCWHAAHNQQDASWEVPPFDFSEFKLPIIKDKGLCPSMDEIISAQPMTGVAPVLLFGKPVISKPQKIKATWNSEVTQDLLNWHGLSVGGHIKDAEDLGDIKTIWKVDFEYASIGPASDVMPDPFLAITPVDDNGLPGVSSDVLNKALGAWKKNEK